MHLLLDPKINENKIATRRPLECSFSVSFVVDVSKLAHPDDIKKDMYGKWLQVGILFSDALIQTVMIFT